MGSQFYGLNIAYTGLLASNASLNTTANNISNVETEGYSRQQVTQTAAEALELEVRPRAQHLPLLRAAGVFLFHGEDVADLYIHYFLISSQ